MLAKGRFPRLQVIWADAAYAGRLVAWAWETGGWLLKVVRRRPDSHQFEVLPRRWVVERTLSRCRRLSKDYEELPETGETWVHIAMVHLMLKRLKRARESTPLEISLPTDVGDDWQDIRDAATPEMRHSVQLHAECRAGE